jgi:ABC-2 type transport system ATP-binding protein
VEIIPVQGTDHETLRELLRRFGECPQDGQGPVRVQLPKGESQLAEVIRALDQADLHVESLHLHQPSLDDVFLAKTGRKLEGSADEEDEAEPAGGGRGRRRGR